MKGLVVPGGISPSLWPLQFQELYRFDEVHFRGRYYDGSPSIEGGNPDIALICMFHGQSASLS